MLDAVRANAAVYVLAYSTQIAVVAELQPFDVLEKIPVVTNGWRVDSLSILVPLDRVHVPVHGWDHGRRR